MADAEEICAALSERSFSAIGLVLNERGLDRALECDLDEINCVAYAADGYAEKNTGASAKNRNDEAAGLIARAREAGRKTSVTISVAFGDPVDGEVSVESVGAIVEQMAAAGVDEVAFGDTIGVADPRGDSPPRPRPQRRFRRGAAMPLPQHPQHRLRQRHRRTRCGRGCPRLGGRRIRRQPLLPGAGGNVASEDLAWMLTRMGIDTGLDVDQLAATGVWLARSLGQDQPPAMLGKTPNWP